MQNKNTIDTSYSRGIDQTVERSIALSMKRLATVFGNIDEISEDEKSMVVEMSRLKKYDRIREIIKTRNGFINIVVRDCYQPLIEQIILSAIPAGAGGIYNAGMESVIPGDYDIDAERVFGSINGTAADQKMAVSKFGDLVLGSPPPITPKTFKDRSWTREKLMMTFGKTRGAPATDEDDAIEPQPVWPIVEQFFTYYERIQTLIERPASDNDTSENPGIFKRDMMADYDLIMHDTLARNKNVSIRKKNKDNEGVVGYNPIPLETTLSPENLKALKLKFIDNRNQYLRYKKEAVNMAVQQLITPPQKRGNETQLPAVAPATIREVMPIIQSLLAGRMIGDSENVYGKAQREGGFLGTKEVAASKLAALRTECSAAFRKTQTITNNMSIDQAEKVKQTSESRKEEKKRLFDLYDYVYNLKTTDEKAARLKEQILKNFVETKTIGGVEETVWPEKAEDISPVSIIYKFNDMSKDVAELVETVKKTENRVLILSNVDASALVSPVVGGGRDTEKNQAAMTGQLNAFSVALSRSSTSPKTLILISKEPLGGMGYVPDKYDRKQFIDFADYPVDTDEARIIVKHVFENDYGTEFKKEWIRKLTEGLDAKRLARLKEIDANPGPNAARAKQELKQQIAIEKENLVAHAQGAYERSIPQAEQLEEAETMLVGLEQQSAIGLVKECVQRAKKNIMVEKDGISRLDQVDLDLEVWAKGLVERGNELHQDSVPGLSKRRSRVKFKDYIFAKTVKNEENAHLKWGDCVGKFSTSHKNLMEAQKKISDVRTDRGGLRDAYEAILNNPKSTAHERHQAELSLAALGGIITQSAQEKAVSLSACPHLIILYGKSGVGKTVWADALADLFGFTIMSVDFGGAKDKWLGNTEKFTDRIISVIKNSKNAVILIDEMDRDLGGGGAQGGGAGSKQGGHEVNHAITKKLMALFEDDKDRLVQNNVFILITTNYVKDFDPALVARTEGNVYEVVAPTDEADYKQYMDSFLETEKRFMPNDPWINSIKSRSPSELNEYSSAQAIEAISAVRENYTMADYWKEVENLLRSIPMDTFCKIMAQKRLSFRTVCSMMRRAVAENSLYESTKLRFQRGDTDQIQGMPFTLENLVMAASMAHEDPEDFSKNTDGVGEVSAGLRAKANKQLETLKASGGFQKRPMISVVEGKPYTPEKVLEMIKNKQAKMWLVGVVGYNYGFKVYIGEEQIAIAQADLEGNVIMGNFFPEEIDRMMVHEMPQEENIIDGDNQQFTVEEGELGGKVFHRMKPKPPQQPPVGKTMEELVNSGMVDQTPEAEDVIAPSETEIKPSTSTGKAPKSPRKIEDKTPKDKKTEITSTTDYYYDFLMKMGVIQKIAQYQQQMYPEPKPAVSNSGTSNPQTATNVPGVQGVPSQQGAAPQEQPWFDDVEKYGVYYFQDGQALVMPAGPDEEPQYLSVTKGRQTR